MGELEQTFGRYVRMRDPDLLGEVFDRVAPRLLRLAIHLRGDAAEAEDLVQGTFLAAIERAAEFDASRELLPWLLGILANKARLARRDAGRHLDPERLLGRAEATPLEEAEGAELSGALAKALDRLEEPYRQVLVLRLRHGMRAADIAHVLDRSPGAVRIQIHRGLQKLRGLLPTGFAGVGLLALDSGRGLAAVREAVLAKAAVSSALATGSAVAGGALMIKKAAAAAVILAAAIAVGVWSPWGEEAEPTASAMGAAEEAAFLVAASEAGEALEGVPQPQAATPPVAERIAALQPQEQLFLEGQVVDGMSGDPIEGAVVRLHMTRSMMMSELLSSRWQYLEVTSGGTIRPRMTVPCLRDYPSPAACFGLEPIEVYDWPPAGEAPLAETRSDSQGRFRLPFSKGGGVLVCEREGLATLARAAPDPELMYTVKLWPKRPLSGYVVDTQGRRIGERLELLFKGVSSPAGAGMVLVKTEANGDFELEIDARVVRARCMTPGWSLTDRGVHPDNGRMWYYQTSLVPGRSEPVLLVARRTLMLQVRDADTREDIEDFCLMASELHNGMPMWSGRFHAPGGALNLIPFSWSSSGSSRTWTSKKSMSLSVWADGYRATSLLVSDLHGQGTIEADLQLGEVPALEGHVYDGTRAIQGAEMSLILFRTIEWRERDRRRVDFARTDEEGSCRLSAPEGRYLLRASYAGRSKSQIVSLPQDSGLVIDFADPTSIEVLVRDSDGGLQANHVVALDAPDGRSQTAHTDDEGRAVFELLPPGAYSIFAPHITTEGSFSADVLEKIDLASGERRLVELTVLARHDARHAVVVTEGVADYSGWRARNPAWDAESWVALDLDGTIPIDIQMGVPKLEIEHPDGRRWDAEIPDEPPDGYEIYVDLEGLRYEGVLLRLTDGRPRAGVRIVARPRGVQRGESVEPSAVTDQQGRFVLWCTRRARHTFTFNTDSAGWSWDRFRSPLGWHRYDTAGPPGEVPQPMEIRLPDVVEGKCQGVPDVRFTGRVLRSSNETPLSGIWLHVRSLFPDGAGVLDVGLESSGVVVAPDGRFDLTVPAAPRYGAAIIDRDKGAQVLYEEWDAVAGETEISREFTIE